MIGSTRDELSDPKYDLPRDTVDQIADGLQSFLEGAAPTFDRRVSERRIIEGHGDLRPEHVCLTMPEPVIIDCLEFNRDFRIVDPCDELAFLAMDCERLGAPWVWDVVFETYRSAMGDVVDDALPEFYAASRALVRAKIAVWHLNEPNVRYPQKWPTQAAAYLDLARRHIDRMSGRD